MKQFLIKTFLFKLFFFLTVLFTLYTLISATDKSFKVQADEIKTNVFKFYIDPQLVPDMQFAKINLTKYVNDMNYVLAKNTNRRLVFNPETDITLTSTPPHTGTGGSLPTDGYEIWAHIATASAQIYSYGGIMSFDISGAAVLADLHWTRIYDPDTIAPNSDQARDYWIQIDHMLHEYGHIHGAAIGEYYNLGRIKDNTGVDPVININLTADDNFWSDKTDFFTDPMLAMVYGNDLIGNPTSRSACLDAAKYSNLTAAIINGNYRNPTIMPPTTDLQNLSIQIIDNLSHLPIANARVKIWSIGGYNWPNNPAQLLFTLDTNINGLINFAWGSPGDPHNNYDFLRLIKVRKGGYQSAAKYVSIFDTDIQKLVIGRATYSTTVYLDSDPTSSPDPSPIPGDINGDGYVNSADLNLVIKNWLGIGICNIYNCDLNNDGKINILDAAVVIAHW